MQDIGHRMRSRTTTLARAQKISKPTPSMTSARASPHAHHSRRNGAILASIERSCTLLATDCPRRPMNVAQMSPRRFEIGTPAMYRCVVRECSWSSNACEVLPLDALQLSSFIAQPSPAQATLHRQAAFEYIRGANVLLHIWSKKSQAAQYATNAQ